MNSHLVGEDRVVLGAEAVVAEQLVAQEHRRPRHREHVRGIDLLDVEHRPLVLRLALEVGEVLLRLVRQVVDHRPPDRTGELREVRLGLAERQQLLEVERVRVVLVQDAGGAVVDRQAGVADRAVGGCAQRRHHEPQRPALDDLAGLRVGDVREAELAQIGLEVVGRVVGKEDLDVLRHVPLEEPRVEVVAVPVRHVEEVGFAVLLPVQRAVVGEREPGAEEGGLDPRVAQDAAAEGLDEHARVAETGDPHGADYSSECRRLVNSPILRRDEAPPCGPAVLTVAVRDPRARASAADAPAVSS